MFGSRQGVFGAEGRAFLNSSRKFLQGQFLKMHLRHSFWKSICPLE